MMKNRRGQSRRGGISPEGGGRVEMCIRDSFMGTLFGVLMLPILYDFIKRLSGSTRISICGTVIFAFDFMHFVQTRIATIDTYSVFFILLMYLCLLYTSRYDKVHTSATH